jgi:putative transposase
MTLQALYLLVRSLLGCLTVLTQQWASKDAGLLVLRREVAVLRRTHPRPRLEWAGGCAYAQ